MIKPFTCICSNNKLFLPESQTDLKCPKCGRVYTNHGLYLWQEAAGNDIPGSSDILPKSEGDKRAVDQGEAIGEGFAAGVLPEADRRPDDGSDTAVKLGERLDAPPVIRHIKSSAKK